MGPFGGSTALEVGLVLVVLGVCFAIWVFNAGRRAAGPKTPETTHTVMTDMSPIRGQLLVCLNCQAKIGEAIDGLCEPCFVRCYPGAAALLNKNTSSRTSNSPTKPSATG